MAILGLEFVDEIKGGSIPREFIPSVQKGIESALDQGPLAGYPMEGIKARLYDGKFHNVDSDQLSFEIAGRMALREAARRATPGTRVRVAAGEYGITRTDVQGEAGAPIAFVADGEVVIAAREGTGWSMSDGAFVVIEGFTIRDAAIHGMNLDDGGDYATPAHHIVLRNLTIRDAGSGGNNDCIKMSGVDDFWIEGSDVAGCDRGEIVDMVGCHRGVIRGNTFADAVRNGVQTKGGSADVRIHGNRFRRIPGRAVNAGGSTGLEFFRPLDAPYEAARIAVVANVIEDGGEESGAAVAFVGCDACLAAHNVILRPRGWVARILQESTQDRFVPSRDGRFVNNLVVLDTTQLRSFLNVGTGTAPETFVFGHNLWFATNEGASWGGPTLGGGVPAEEGSLVQVDPALDAEARPGAGNAAYGAGRALSETFPDLAGRCYATPPSIGAFAAP